MVVGAGPAGLVAGITLARYGIDVLVVDKRGGVSRSSRSLVISTRGMELMRRFGLETAIRSGAAADGRSARGRRAPRPGIHDARANVICPWFR